MRIRVDASLCDAHAQCVIFAPELFEIAETDDGDEIAVVLDESPPGSLLSAAQAAARACPVRAIAVTED